MAENALKALSHFCIMAPIQGPQFLFWTAYIRDRKVESGIQNVKDKFWYQFNWSLRYWPFALFTAYQFVPYHVRLPFTNCLAYVWAVFLSYINNNKIGK